MSVKAPNWSMCSQMSHNTSNLCSFLFLKEAVCPARSKSRLITPFPVVVFLGVHLQVKLKVIVEIRVAKPVPIFRVEPFLG